MTFVDLHERPLAKPDRVLVCTECGHDVGIHGRVDDLDPHTYRCIRMQGRGGARAKGRTEPQGGRMKPALPLDEILEKDWQRDVRKLADTLGYRRAYHTFDSRRSDTGFPDLVLVSPQRRRIVYLELKREQGKLTARQAGWIRDLHHAGAEVYVARPRHLQALTSVLGPASGTNAYFEARAQLLRELDPILQEAA